jgi:hypothetical protein
VHGRWGRGRRARVAIESIAHCCRGATARMVRCHRVRRSAANRQTIPTVSTARSACCQASRARVHVTAVEAPPSWRTAGIVTRGSSGVLAGRTSDLLPLHGSILLCSWQRRKSLPLPLQCATHDQRYNSAPAERRGVTGPGDVSRPLCRSRYYCSKCWVAQRFARPARILGVRVARRVCIWARRRGSRTGTPSMVLNTRSIDGARILPAKPPTCQ